MKQWKHTLRAYCYSFSQPINLQPQYLHDLISVQSCHNTRSSSMVIPARRPTRSSLKITNRSFRYAAPCLMEWTPHWSLRASSDTVSCTFSYHTWQFVIFTIFTITACIFSYSLSISFWTQNLALQQTLSSIDLFLSYRTDYTDSQSI